MNTIEQMQDRVLLWFAFPNFEHKTKWSYVHTKSEDVYLIMYFFWTFGKNDLDFHLFVFFTTVNKSLVTWNQLTPASKQKHHTAANFIHRQLRIPPDGR